MYIPNDVTGRREAGEQFCRGRKAEELWELAEHQKEARKSYRLRRISYAVHQG
jgi:hypothetical protein